MTATIERVAALVDRSPMRRRILELIPELELQVGRDGVSPVELTRALSAGPAGAPSLGTVAYHVRVLAEAGALRLVRKTQRRGAVEHFYTGTDLGTAGVEATPLEVAVRALEAIAASQGGAAVSGRLAREALEDLGRRPRSSVAA